MKKIFLTVFYSSVLLLIFNQFGFSQNITQVSTFPLDVEGKVWQVDVSFGQTITIDQVEKVYILNDDDDVPSLVPLSNIVRTNFGFTAITTKPLETVLPPNATKRVLKKYVLNARIKSAQGVSNWQLMDLTLLDDNTAVSSIGKKAAKDVEDADIYIAGEINGGHKRKTRYSAEIKAQYYKPIGSWRHTPFFKLNASTDPEADPDSMELGWRFRRIYGESKSLPPVYWDNDVKIESERDFDNTNFVVSSKLTFLPTLPPKDKKSKYKVFIYPFVGIEAGKNLKSPLPAAKGDGIARIIAGADARLAIFLNKETGKGIEWNTSYTRRWLLTDELKFKENDDESLSLVTFGKSPRDFIQSKLTYTFNQRFGVFTAYEWGELPPSYKFVDHRFRLGLVYKFKFGIK